MKLDTATPLKALNLAEQPGRVGGVGRATKLSPADLSGVISHPKRNKVAGSAAGANSGPLAAPVGVQGAAQGTQHDRLVGQTRQWVAQTFFGTLLKQMRDSPFKSDLFEGGRGGQAFSSLYDQKLIEHMSRGAGGKIVNATVRKLEAKARAAAAYSKQHGADTPVMTMPAPAASQPGSSDGPRDDDRDNPYRNVKIHVAPALRA